jgi:hypothetical protein
MEPADSEYPLLTRIPLGLSLADIDERVRREHEVDIALTEAGCFFTAVNESADALADALDFRIGIDAWGRRVTGFPVNRLDERSRDLVESGYGFAVVRTVDRRNHRAVRAVTDVVKGQSSGTSPRTRRIDGVGDSVDREESAAAKLQALIAQAIPALPSHNRDAEGLVEALSAAALLDSSDSESESERRLLAHRIFDERLALLERLWERRNQRPTAQFDLRRLSSILDRIGHGIRRGPNGARRHDHGPLTSDENQDIAALFFEGRGVREISGELDRPASVISRSLTGQNLRAEDWRRWWPDETNRLKSLLCTELSLRTIAKKLSRSPWDVLAHTLESDARQH